MSMGSSQLVCCCFFILASFAISSHAHATAGISVQRNEVHWNKKGGMLQWLVQLLGRAHWRKRPSDQLRKPSAMIWLAPVHHDQHAASSIGAFCCCRGGATVAGKCRAGKHGLKCSQCPKGYYSTDGIHCQRCTNSRTTGDCENGCTSPSQCSKCRRCTPAVKPAPLPTANAGGMSDAIPTIAAWQWLAAAERCLV